MRESFDIFVGGPMGGSAKDPSGVPFSEHIGRLEKALQTISEEVNSDQTQFTVRIHNPEDARTGMITETILGLIDTAELGVMDVSAGSPSVMYELAIMHALGIPTIPVIMRNTEGRREAPFYLKDTYQAVVDDFEHETLVKELRPKVAAVLAGPASGANTAGNPISSFYGLPMVDISASTGLATGYFHNFIQHVIKQNDSVFNHLAGEVDQLVIIRPDRLSDAAGLKQATDAMLNKAGVEIEQVGNKDGQVYEDREQARGQMLIWRAGRFLYDAPSPLAAQEKSPRYEMLRRQRIPASSTGEIAVAAQQIIEKFEQRMIDAFFEVLTKLAETYPNTNPNRLKFLTATELVAAASDQ